MKGVFFLEKKNQSGHNKDDNPSAAAHEKSDRSCTHICLVPAEDSPQETVLALGRGADRLSWISSIGYARHTISHEQNTIGRRDVKRFVLLKPEERFMRLLPSLALGKTYSPYRLLASSPSWVSRMDSCSDEHNPPPRPRTHLPSRRLSFALLDFLLHLPSTPF